MRRALLASLALISSTSLAAAQPGLEPTTPAPASQPGDAGHAGHKDPNRALLLSAAASALGLATVYMGANMRAGGDTPIMMVGSLVAVLGPSMGAWYVDDGFKMTPGLGIRLGGVAVMGLAFGAVIDRSCVRGCEGPLRDDQSDVMIGLGAAMVVAGMIYDVATVRSRAHEHNAGLAFTPVIAATPTGDALVGVATQF